MATTLFQKKAPEDVRGKRFPLRLTSKERDDIQHLADIRNLDMSEYIRRAALGRKADVSYEIEIVLALSNVTKAIRDMHAALVAQGIAPPDAVLLPVVLDARAAMLRIGK